MNDTHGSQQPEPGDAPQPNDQDQPQQPPHQGPAAPPGPAPQESARFFTWLRSLGVQRGSSRWVGGVCSGLADRWGIDPVIVRGLTVVLTIFFGIGLLAYGVAWALLPEPDGRIHVEQVGRGHWSTGMTGAAVATFLGLAGPGQGVVWDGHGGWFPWPVLWVAGIVAVIVWAVNRGKGGRTRPAPGQQQHFAAPGRAPGYDPVQVPGPVPGQPAGQAHGQAPGPIPGPYSAERLTRSVNSWTERNLGASGPLGTNGPLGAAGPLGTNGLLGPHGPLALKQRTPRLGAAASLLSLGLAVMAGALLLILDASGVLDLHGYQAAAAAAVAAITAGLAIIISGIRGRTAGGVGTFAIIALVVAGLLSMIPQHGQWTPLVHQSWAPTSVSAAQDGLTVVLGNATVDLTKLDAGTPLEADVLIPIDLAASQVVIKVPTSIPVTIKSDLAAAALRVQGRDGNDGNALVQSSTTRINPDATGNGLVVTLDGAAGNVTIVPVAGK
ncbi:hypothetical protein CVV68_11215 [Arthrobacter livingstonensis]|uniref:Phage shock protein PspC N-terminal domain-containing protein n=1 Tax=Arthrobacter livingstonensis TaxID=670078 RepID=A0A2V5LA14_9MICC|nr:PspC domain-containing protein [Arthrobacter livingstonensis]PYI67294.1 hypothetical protein CVV68_11215 [Arthrobacter livingstonensis]